LDTPAEEGGEVVDKIRPAFVDRRDHDHVERVLLSRSWMMPKAGIGGSGRGVERGGGPA
jgi:hypothetical protein